MTEHQTLTVRLDADDNVVTARIDLLPNTAVTGEDVACAARIPAGHKIATRPIRAGEPVRKYNQIIGFAREDIAPGEHVHVHNVELHDFDRDYDCPVGPVYVIPSWGNVPWLKPEYYETIQTGDLDGDGVDELIGRDVAGVHVFMYSATLGGWRPVLTLDGADELVLGDLSDLNGWHAPQYYKTIRLVRLASPEPMSLVARAASGLIVYRFTRGPDTPFGFPTGSWGRPRRPWRP